MPGARILSDELGPTFIGFDGDTGAIDHLIVAGANAEAFDKASAPTVTADAFHGSDHRPVVARAEAGHDPTDPEERIEDLLQEIDTRLNELRTLIVD
ncbi:hypothetical protein OCH239_15395 [Roseivivax halodurans JCM 10272]|uniref:Endonuclease/exonuclease/phosphatase domain-containing protein n=1 Tax=Roseivivax halodurans JCM 10272 TaxID=1449350 RepID=X7ECM8_9RHOB|nr:hypothetical protein OCH239_15395 [Roseivivax halodurans JCM 10272]